MSKILFLDDDPSRAKEFKEERPNDKIFWADTAAECISQLKEEIWDQVWLDHDLGGKIFVSVEDEETGSAVVRFIVEQPECNIPKETQFYVHSLNSYAAINMVKMLREAGFPALYRPFGAEYNKERDDFVDTECAPFIVDDLPGIYIIGGELQHD